MNFPPEIVAMITHYTGDIIVAQVLRKYMSKQIYRQILLTKRKILIYGQVQSGKTAAIMDVLENPVYTGITKIIIIQNTLLVLNQYKERLASANIDHQIFQLKSATYHSDVIVLMNNSHRYKHYLNSVKTNPQKYIVLMDEADAYKNGTHPLAEGAIHEYYVTATPLHKNYEPGYFNHIQRVDEHQNYQGLTNVNITYQPNNDELEAIAKFYADTQETSGIMLINTFRYVNEMQRAGMYFSTLFPQITFVALNTKRKIYKNGTVRKIKQKSISKIIDKLAESQHIVFIANRLSLRGLSYTSGTYARHLTHQFSDLNRKSDTNRLQRMRIFGIYGDQQQVQLMLPENNRRIVQRLIHRLDVQPELNRTFTM
jgi:thymidine kinase